MRTWSTALPLDVRLLENRKVAKGGIYSTRNFRPSQDERGGVPIDLVYATSVMLVPAGLTHKQEQAKKGQRAPRSPRDCRVESTRRVTGG